VEHKTVLGWEKRIPTFAPRGTVVEDISREHAKTLVAHAIAPMLLPFHSTLPMGRL